MELHLAKNSSPRVKNYTIAQNLSCHRQAVSISEAVTKRAELKNIGTSKRERMLTKKIIEAGYQVTSQVLVPAFNQKTEKCFLYAVDMEVVHPDYPNYSLLIDYHGCWHNSINYNNGGDFDKSDYMIEANLPYFYFGDPEIYAFGQTHLTEDEQYLLFNQLTKEFHKTFIPSCLSRINEYFQQIRENQEKWRQSNQVAKNQLFGVPLAS